MVREQDDLVSHILRNSEEESTSAVGQSTYQSSLRALGNALDAENAGNVTVIEVVDGYIARFEIGGRFDYRAFDRHQVLAADKAASAERGSAKRSPYGDLFRVMGRGWDRMAAINILIEEVGGTFIVTYLHPDPSAAVFMRKRYAVITPEIASQALGRAGARRSPEPPKGWLFRR